MIDLHTHVLPGIDDGPAELEAAVELATIASERGVRTLAATPHVSERYPTTVEAMQAGVAELSAQLAQREITLGVCPGGEVEAERIATLEPADLRGFSLAGAGRYLLVELPWEAMTAEATAALGGLRTAGLVPIVAHPERYDYVQAAPARLEALAESGALFQVTVSSLLGHHGRSSERAARDLLEAGLAHLLASDVHGRGLRRAGLWEARAAVRDDSLALWLTQLVPAAVLAGEPLPPRPEPRRRLLGRRARR
jgi:protein-tyrosine phosphatase